MTDLRTAAQQALEALESLHKRGVWGDFYGVADTLRAALEQPEQEQQAEVQALMKVQSELQRQRDYWEEEARRYAGNADFWKNKHEQHGLIIEDLQYFANLVAAAEREACAKVCEQRGMVKGGEVFAARIRARGEKCLNSKCK